MHGEGVGEALALAEQHLVRAHRALALRVHDEGRADHADPLAGQAEPTEGVARPRAALERGADELGAEAALHVGAGAHAQQVQGDQLRGVAQGGGRAPR